MSDGNLISKTQRKRQMHELQDLGLALTRLPAEQLARIDLPDSLRESVIACRAMTKHEAVRRQLQYIGRLMRRIDAAPIARQLEALHAPSGRQTALFHRAEQWRADMLADNEAISRFALDHPGADAALLRELVEGARAERAASQPPRRFRRLFQAINQCLQPAEEEGEAP